MKHQAGHSEFLWLAHKERFTDIRKNSDLFSKNVADEECVYSAARIEHPNKMAFNTGIPMFIGANVLADRLTLNNEIRVAPLHVRFVEDEISVRVFLSPTGVPFTPPIAIYQCLQSSKHTAISHFLVHIRTASYAVMWLFTQQVNYLACLIYMSLMNFDNTS